MADTESTMQTRTFLKKVEENQTGLTENSKRRGPPNRMNDLPYKEWMKFQKSFFRYSSTISLVEEYIYFFTKAIWPEGHSSRSLLVGFEAVPNDLIPGPRVVDSIPRLETLSELVRTLQNVAKKSGGYDFILIDLRSYLATTAALDEFLDSFSFDFYSTLKKLMVPERYCGVLVETIGEAGAGFPLPWSVALAGRDQLRLRDEKVGLIEDCKKIVYCLLMQATEDGRSAAMMRRDSINVADTQTRIPAWTIPKPPPRKKNEVLHPAKYPETLIEEFINLFSKPGDRVLDPMVGTGSSVVAALRTERNGYGVDLIDEFVQIARDRAAGERRPMLFPDMETDANGLIIQGDATDLRSIADLEGITFQYAITSPPYWSMLRNAGSEGQEKRRKKNLKLVYSENERDLGNVEDYETFLQLLDKVYGQVAEKLDNNGRLTVIVKNIKREHIVFPLAWDIVARLCGHSGPYRFLGTTLWCQDDVGLKPFAVGIHWVSNTLHNYCLHFQKK